MPSHIAADVKLTYKAYKENLLSADSGLSAKNNKVIPDILVPWIYRSKSDCLEPTTENWCNLGDYENFAEKIHKEHIHLSVMHESYGQL